MSLSPLQLQEPRYARRRVTLTGSQPLSFPLGFPSDFIAFIDVAGVDTTKVYVAFNEPHEFIPLDKVIVARLPEPVIYRLLFRWEPSEEGKIIEVYYAGAPGLELGTQPVSIGSDYVGLAKESTQQSMLTSLQSIDSKVATEATQQSILDKLTATLLAEALTALDNSAGTTAAALDIFASNVNVTDPGVLSLQLALDTATTVKLRIVRGANTLEYYVNGGNNLNANAWYEFDISVLSGDAVNVIVDVPAGAVVNAYVALVLRKR